MIRHSQGISIHVIPGSQQEAGRSNKLTTDSDKGKQCRSQTMAFFIGDPLHCLNYDDDIDVFDHYPHKFLSWCR